MVQDVQRALFKKKKKKLYQCLLRQQNNFYLPSVSSWKKGHVRPVSLLITLTLQDVVCYWFMVLYFQP